ncbi:DUF6801 domain-containing protein [Prauserella flavalba]|uniref:DUF6801 domain-containing protein n=1 Tax=Prauserella flavalba TaxID=1477506 RepID=A0A318LDW2_9PSEU|nr:DUF6801 domain-containing protein [Prauserella flavalba]PXY24204.1 hypothetical protein BA062_28650 [Prauserella flavalba]
MGLVAAISGFVGAGSAQAAADVTYGSQTLRYECSYPVIGFDYLDVEIEFKAPDAVPANSQFVPYDIVATATVPQNVVELLYYVAGIDGVRGTADGTVSLTNGSPGTVTIGDLAVAEQFVVDPLNDFPVIAEQGGSTVVPTITAGSPGVLTANMGDYFAASLDFHYYNATPEWQGPETFECFLDTTSPQNTAFSPNMTVS